MAELFYKSMERKLNCSVCDAKAVSVCNYRSRNFRGCGQPFCFSHGVSQKFKDFHLVDPLEESPENKSQRMLLSRIFQTKRLQEVRCCGDCLQFAGTWFKRALDGILISALFLMGIASVIFFFSTATKQCFGDEIWDPLKNLCNERVRSLSPEQQLGWFEFQNSFVGGSDCKIQTYGEGTSAKGAGELPQLDLKILCRCSGSAYAAVFRVVESQVERRTLCKTQDDYLRATCPPNGSNWISSTGACSSRAPFGVQMIVPLPSGYLKEDGQEIHCPLGTMLNLESKLCQISSCPWTFYYLNASTGQCQNCPLYEKRDHPSPLVCRSSKDLIKRKAYMKEVLNNPKQCPAASPHLNSSQLQEADDLGYYSLAVDPFGYKQCPVVKEEGSFQRECQPSEMLIRFIIKCKSPCLPCKEKWDFARKKCIPVEAVCPARQQSMLHLTSSGDCLERGELNPSSLLSDAGEFYCPD